MVDWPTIQKTTARSFSELYIVISDAQGPRRQGGIAPNFFQGGV